MFGVSLSIVVLALLVTPSALSSKRIVCHPALESEHTQGDLLGKITLVE